MQDVRARAIAAGQVRHRLVEQPVARGDTGRRLGPGHRLGVPARALGRVGSDLRAEHLAGQRHHDASRGGGLGLAGRRPERDEQGVAEEVLGVDGEAPIRHPDRRIARDGRDHARAQQGRRHQLVGHAQEVVVGQGDVEVGDDAQQPVAAHDQTEEVGVLAGRAHEEIAGGQHQPEGADGRAERAVGHGPAMRVHRQRGRHAEVVVGLHHRGGKAQRIERGDHLAPPRASGHAVGPGGAIDLDPRLRPGLHVEGHGDAVTDERLTAHRVPGGADGDGAALGGGGLELRAQRVQPRAAGHRRGTPVTGDRCDVEPAGVVEDERGIAALGSGRDGAQERSGGAGAEQRAARERLQRTPSGRTVTRCAPIAHPPILLRRRRNPDQLSRASATARDHAGRQ